MKTTMKIVLGAAILFVVIGLIGTFLGSGLFGSNAIAGNSGYSRGAMMFDNYASNRFSSDEKIELEELELSVDRYIEQYGKDLVISDIFVFSDSDYYFSIMEEDTGLGAMELLVNPYTGAVYPEFGPNMMWNLKYGMHGNSSYGMMGGRGMMGRYYDDDYYTSNQNIERNVVSFEDAQKSASEYIEVRYEEKYTVSGDGHEFYGYYTFHLEQDDKTVGMLSVNGFTGEVWHHDWHGTVLEIIDVHES